MNVGTLWAQIGLDNSQLRSGAKESTKIVNELSNDVGVKLPEASDLASKALAGIGTAFTAYSIIKEVKAGIDAIDDLKLTSIQVAAQIATLQGPTNVADNYQKAKVYAAALAKEMERIDTISFANNESLNAMSQTMINQGVILDLNDKKQISSFAALSNAIAMYTAGQNQSIQTRQEMRALLSGEVREGAMLAKQIDEQAKRSGDYKNGLKDIVKLGKEHGDIWARLAPYLAGIEAASGDIQHTWEAVTSSFSTAISMLRRDVFAGVYEDALNKGGQLVEWLKSNSSGIADTIKVVADAAAAGTKIATTYFAAFVVVPAVFDLAVVAIQRFNIQMALASMEMVRASAAARAYAVVMGNDVVTATWAASSAIGKLAMVGQVVMAFFVGWEIGKWIEKHCAVARQAAAALVVGLEKIWATVKAGGKMVLAVQAAAANAAKGNFSGALANIEGVVREYKNEMAEIDKLGYQTFVDAGKGSTVADTKATGKLDIPKIPASPKASSKSDISNLAEQQATYDRQVRESERAIKDQEAKMDIARTQDSLKAQLELIKQKNEAGLISDREYLKNKYTTERAADESELADLKRKSQEAYKNYSATSDNPNTDLKQQNEDWNKYLQAYEAVAKKIREMNLKTSLYPGEVEALNRKEQQNLSDLSVQILEAKGKYEDAARAKATFEKTTPEYKKSTDEIKKSKDQLIEWSIEEGRRKDLATATGITLTQIEDKLAKVQTEETNRTISSIEAAQKKIELYNQEKIALQARYNAEKGVTETSRQLQEQLRQSIASTNEKINAQNKILFDKTAWGGITNAIKSYKDSVADLGASIQTTLTNAFNNMENTLVDFIAKGKGSWKNFIDTLISDLTRLAVRQFIMKPLMDSMDSMMTKMKSTIDEFFKKQSDSKSVTGQATDIFSFLLGLKNKENDTNAAGIAANAAGTAANLAKGKQGGGLWDMILGLFGKGKEWLSSLFGSGGGGGIGDWLSSLFGKAGGAISGAAISAGDWFSSLFSLFAAKGGVWDQGVQKFAKGGVVTPVIEDKIQAQKFAKGGVITPIIEDKVQIHKFAKGGVVTPITKGHEIRAQKFAKGGVVTKPTSFQTNKGSGLMGEAGPEAIMPLSRGSDGSLGVRLTDSSLTSMIPSPSTNNTFSPTYQIDARNSTLSHDQIKSIVDRSVRQSKSDVLNSMNRFGEFAVAAKRGIV